MVRFRADGGSFDQFPRRGGGRPGTVRAGRTQPSVSVVTAAESDAGPESATFGSGCGCRSRTAARCGGAAASSGRDGPSSTFVHALRPDRVQPRTVYKSAPGLSVRPVHTSRIERRWPRGVYRFVVAPSGAETT